MPVKLHLPPSPKSLRDETCTACPLHASCTSVCVPGSGDTSANIVFVGEAPGEEEDKQCAPFVGRAGRLLDNILSEVGLQREACYITNVVKCRPPGNRNPGIREIRACTSRYLWGELQIVQPKVVVLLGQHAIKAYLNRTQRVSLKEHRGRDMSSDQEPWAVYCTYHPAAILYDDSRLPYLLEDIRKIKHKFLSAPVGRKIYEPEYHFYTSSESARDLINTDWLRERVSFDVETNGTNPFARNAYVGYVNMSHMAHYGLVIPARNFPEMEDQFRFALNDPSIMLVNQALKFDLKWAWRKGWLDPAQLLDKPIFCTLNAAHLIDENRPSKELGALLLQDTDMEEVGDADGKHPLDMSRAEITLYGGTDADGPLRLQDVYTGWLEEDGLTPLFNLQMDVLKSLTYMEISGIKTSKEEWRKLDGEYQEIVDDLTQSICRHAGPINLRSNPQLADFIYNKMGLPVLAKAKGGGPSCAKDAITDLLSEANREQKPILKDILEFKTAAKIYDAFITKLPEHRDPRGFIHATYNQASSKTRLSCKEPNLQQIPKEGKSPIKRMFVSRFKGGWILLADYSQIELRWLAYMSQDKTFMDAYQRGLDIHAITASNLFQKELLSVTEAERDVGKTLNFAILYGAQAKRISRVTGLSPHKAAKFIETWYRSYPGAKDYRDRTRIEVLRNGYVSNPFGRRRRLVVLEPGTYKAERVMRQAVNSPIQSGAADMLNLVMATIQFELIRRKMRSRLILSVHDELGFDCPHEEIDEVVELVYLTMTNPPTKEQFGFEFNVPLDVDISCGRNWLDQEPYFEEE